MKRIYATILLSALVIFGVSSIPAMAQPQGNDPDEEEVTLQDFDIRSFGFSGKDPYMQVYGHAGRTIASEEEQIFAYVFHTDTGIWAANNHGFGHADPEGDEGNIWHSEQIFLNKKGCLTSAENESENRISGSRVTLVGTGATEISKVQTVELEHIQDDPRGHGCPAGTIAKLVDVFDVAPDE